MSEPCPFCDIWLVGSGITERFDGAFTLKPLNPVTWGHMLVVSEKHVPDMAYDPDVTAKVMHAAAQLAQRERACNVITSRGALATQTVFHLHVHVVPRTANDGLKLPWSDQEVGVSSGTDGSDG